MVTLTGDRILIDGPILMDNVTELLRSGLHYVAAGNRVVDLSQVSEVDSSAVALLLQWMRAAHRQGGTLSLLEVPESLRTLADLYGVSNLLALP